MADYPSSYSGAEIDSGVGKGLLLPAIVGGDAYKSLKVNAGETAFELVDEYSDTEIDNLLAGKSATGHTHTDEIPSGTVMLFCQATAPTGWTKKSDWVGNSSILVGNNYGAGGTDDPISWTTAIAVAAHAQHNHSITVNARTLSEAMLAIHDHNIGVNDSYSYANNQPASGSNVKSRYGTTENAGSNSGHNHTASSGDGGPTTHSITQDTYTPKYVTVIAAEKD